MLTDYLEGENDIPTHVRRSIQTNKGEYWFVDGDTIEPTSKAEGAPVRFSDMSVPETLHFLEDGTVKYGDWDGEIIADEIAGLANSQGFNILPDDSEEDIYDRLLSPLQNKDGLGLGDKAYYEGIIPLDKFSSDKQVALAEAGRMARGIREIDPNDPWAQARGRVQQHWRDTLVGEKAVALNEAAYAAEAGYRGPESIYVDREAMFLHADRDFMNRADNPFSTAFESSWMGIKQGIQGGRSMLGDALNNEELYLSGKINADIYESKLRELPAYVDDITNIEDVSTAGNYIAGLAGMGLPYILGLVASYGAGAVVGGVIGGPLGAGIGVAAGTAMPWLVYAGDTYHRMGGDKDSKNAGAAMSAGLAMALLDRLGLRGIMKPSYVLTKDGMDQVIAQHAKKTGISIDAATLDVKNNLGKAQMDLLNQVEGVVDILVKKGLVAKSFGKNFGRGAAIEGTTEMAQETTGYVTAHYGGEHGEFDGEEYRRVLINAAAGGALLGGSMSGVSTTISDYGRLKQMQRDYSASADNVEKNYWHGGDAYDQLQTLMDSPEFKEAVKNGDSSSVIKDEYDKAESDDKTVNKGWWKTIKDFPGKFFMKGGSKYLQKMVEDETLPPAVRQAYAILMTIEAPSNKSFMPGQSKIKMKQRLAGKINIYLETVWSNFIAESGLRAVGKDTDAALKTLKEFMAERTRAKDAVVPYGAITVNPVTTQLEREGKLDVYEKAAKELEAVAEMNALLYEKLTGKDLDRRKGYVESAAVLAPAEVRKNKELFVQTLVDGWTHINPKTGKVITTKLSREDAHKFYKAVVEGGETFSMGNMTDAEFKRMGLPDTLRKTSMHLNSSNVMRDTFLEKNMFKVLSHNIASMVDYGVEVQVAGKDGKGVDRVLHFIKSTLEKEGMGDRWDPMTAKVIMDYRDASLGRYHEMENKKLLELQSNLLFFGSITQLDTSLLASLPEIGLLVLNAIHDKEAKQVLMQAAKQLFQHFKKSTKDSMRYMVKGSGMTPEELSAVERDFYAFYGSHATGVLGHIDIGQQIDHMSKFKESVLQAFFTFNLLKPFTDATRIAALSMAQDAIIRDLALVFQHYESGRNIGADAYERLRELGIDPKAMAKEYHIFVNSLHAELKKEGLDPTHDPERYYAALQRIINQELGQGNKDAPFYSLFDQMQIARHSYVDNILANPNSADRPIWYSDPHFRMMGQYQGFLSTFTSHILPRAWRSFRHGNPSARYHAYAAAMTMLMFAFLGQMLKDEWKYEDGHNPWLEDYGYAQRGIMSSGLFGTSERFIDMIHPIYDINEPFLEQLAGDLGPFTGTLSWAHKVLDNAMSGDMSGVGYYAKKATPLFGSSYLFK
mgnify:FL=1